MATDITDRKRLEEALTASALAVSQSDDEALYRELVRYLATILGADAAFIAVPDPHDPIRMTCWRAVWTARSSRTSITPCGTRPAKPWWARSSGSTRRASANCSRSTGSSASSDIESYAGYPLNDANGRALGLDRGRLARSAVSSRPSSSPCFAFSRCASSAEIERDARVRRCARRKRTTGRSSRRATMRSSCTTGTPGAMLDVNPRACEIYGYSRDELLAIDVDAIAWAMPPYTAAMPTRWLEVARRDGHARFEWRRRNRDGALHWDEVLLKACRSAASRGVLVHCAGHHRAQGRRGGTARERRTVPRRVPCLDRRA